MAQGLLTGAIKGPLSPHDPRNHLPRFQAENLAKNLGTIAVLENLAGDKGCTPAQLAVAWILSRGDDIVPLIGMSRRSRLPENIAALDISFSVEELAVLDRSFHPSAMVGDRYPVQVRHLSPKG